MWCPECNITGGCDCYTPNKRKTVTPIDHEKELKDWLEFFLSDDNIDN